MKQSFTVRQRALDDVDTVLSIGQHPNFRKAAADLGVTPSAISQAVRALESRVVGSPDYLARHGRPERVDELRQHACLRIAIQTDRLRPGPSLTDCELGIGWARSCHQQTFRSRVVVDNASIFRVEFDIPFVGIGCRAASMLPHALRSQA